MKLRSYAKINLTLDILNKREDGYHEIKTIFQTIGLYDTIEFHKLVKNTIEFKCNVKDIESSNNLCYRTAEILKNKYNIKKGIKIILNKKIPMGAGLGGGSSNAAVVLKGLNILWNLNLSQDELIEIGKSIGMDVPFHIIGGTCEGTKRGDKIKKITNLDKYYIVLIYPGIDFPTKDIYGSIDYQQIGKMSSTKNFIKKYNIKYIHNDFEYSVIKNYPLINEIKKDIGYNAVMSGSGSSVYGIFKDYYEAFKIFSKLKNKYPKVYLTETRNNNIHVAEVLGFCSGVKRAINKIEQIEDNEGISVLGKLIHNNQVINKLKKKGVKLCDNYNDIEKGTIVISAHGVSDKVINNVRYKGLKVVDVTCPLVKKVHNITKQKENEGRKVIIYGDQSHTEVKGIIGNLNNFKVIKEYTDLTNEDLNTRLSLVSQTTRDLKKFNDIVNKLKNLSIDVDINDTICSATKLRQQSAINISKKSDLVIVIGGKISSNTLRLKETCMKYCETLHIETEAELTSEMLLDKEKIGVTAGASTPGWIIDSVINKIKMLL